MHQAPGGHVAQVAGQGLGPMGLEQLINVLRIDPQQDQALIERQRRSQRLEHRAVEADQGKTVGTLLTERVKRQRCDGSRSSGARREGRTPRVRG